MVVAVLQRFIGDKLLVIMEPGQSRSVIPKPDNAQFDDQVMHGATDITGYFSPQQP